MGVILDGKTDSKRVGSTTHTRGGDPGVKQIDIAEK